MTGNILAESDIAIIGAGPAGVLASLWLSKNNVPHLLIDECDFPRDKSCADIITSNAIRSLNAIDPAIVSEMMKEGLLCPIKGTTIFVSESRSIFLKFKGLDGQETIPSCYSVKRASLDNLLLN
jgi:flavin-dependent dehydrogenase